MLRHVRVCRTPSYAVRTAAGKVSGVPGLQSRATTERLVPGARAVIWIELALSSVSLVQAAMAPSPHGSWDKGLWEMSSS